MNLFRRKIYEGFQRFYSRRDGHNIGASLKSLHKTQFISSDLRHECRLAQLRELINYAAQSNTFYRKRFAGLGFEPGDLKSLEDFARIPLLTKDDIRQYNAEMFSTGYSKANTLHKRTGGSTGVPLHVYMDYPAASFKMAAVRRHNAWAGWVPGSRIAAVWGDTSRSYSIKEQLRNYLTDQAIYLDTLNFTPEEIDKFLDRIISRRHQILMGHAHSIFRLAEYIRDNSKTAPPLQSIITTAMTLSPEERKTIEEVLKAPVFNRYGCEELSIIASECEAHDGLHIFSEGLYVEFLGDSENIPRPLIITDLLNRAMPLIRYDIGDMGRPDLTACPCGRTLPRLKEISGRTADFLYTPDRRPVFGISILDTFVIHIQGFKQVQIVQNRYEHLDFYIVKDEKYTSESLTRLDRNVNEIFGPQMGYKVHFVDKIEMTERGKYRFSICRIGKEGD